MEKRALHHGSCCAKIENVPPSEYLWREWAAERDRARENDRNLIIEREKVAKEKKEHKKFVHPILIG